MDIQIKKGLLEICVLSALERGESYGYQIVKDVPDCMELSESTLYPILKRLEAAKCLAVKSVEYNGRLRKYYNIMGEGKRRVDDFLLEWKDVTRVYDFIKEGAVRE